MVLFSVYPDLPHIARFWMILPSQFRITQNKIHYISLRRHSKKEKPEPATFHKTVGVQANPHEVDTEPPPGCYDISERGKNEEALTGTDV